MEKFIYESKPYFYAIVAACALYYGQGSALMTLSGVFMGLACISIGMLRYDSRSQIVYNHPLKTFKKEKASRAEIEGETHLGQKRYYIG